MNTGFLPWFLSSLSRYSPSMGIAALMFTQVQAAYTCRNEAQPKPPCGTCEDGSATQPGTASEKCLPSVNAGVNQFHFYNGNVSRAVKDLELFGGPGDYQLAFSRIFASRASTTPYHFGGGTLWRHSFQWDLSDEINNWIKITDPH